jgi:hypothetical protein
MDFDPYGAFPSSDVPVMVDQQNSWNSLIIRTYLLYLEWNIGILAINICILWPPALSGCIEGIFDQNFSNFYLAGGVPKFFSQFYGGPQPSESMLSTDLG